MNAPSRRRLGQIVVLFGGILWLSGCGRGREADPVKRGQALFLAQDCQRCHMFNERGVQWGPDLTMVGFRRSPAWLNLWLKEPRAWHSITVMPTFRLTDEERSDLVAFLSTQKGQAWGGARPWNDANVPSDPAQAGRVIFEKAGCIGCHGKSGQGGYPNNNVAGNKIPALTLAADGYTKDEMLLRIKNGVVPVPADPAQPSPLVRMPPWGEMLSDREIKFLVDYIYSLRPALKEDEKW